MRLRFKWLGKIIIRLIPYISAVYVSTILVMQWLKIRFWYAVIIVVFIGSLVISSFTKRR